MVTKEEIFEKVKTTLIDDFEIEDEEVVLDAHIYKDLDLDSLDAIDLMVTLDKQLGIETKPEAMKNLATIDDVCGFIVDTVAAKENG